MNNEEDSDSLLPKDKGDQTSFLLLLGRLERFQTLAGFNAVYQDMSVVVSTISASALHAGLILGLRSANERRRYKVTPSLIAWAQTYHNQHWHMFRLISVTETVHLKMCLQIKHSESGVNSVFCNFIMVIC